MKALSKLYTLSVSSHSSLLNAYSRLFLNNLALPYIERTIGFNPWFVFLVKLSSLPTVSLLGFLKQISEFMVKILLRFTMKLDARFLLGKTTLATHRV